jgi:hypothetical protein
MVKFDDMNSEYACVFENFKIVYNNNTLEAKMYENGRCIDVFPMTVQIQEKTKFTLEEILKFLKPVIDIFPFEIAEHFVNKDDPFHWQQPCCTELQAYKIHTEILEGSNFNRKNRTIDMYLGLPWAMFIDRKYYIGDLVQKLGKKIANYKKLARSIGCILNVHTVCQSIHWKHYLDHFYHIGVTDLHASHYTASLTRSENPYGLRCHAWHLYAVNVEDPSRNSNIVINNFNRLNPLLASFKGAYMPHYLSEIRLLLNTALTRDKIKSDIYLEINDEWYFNKDVFAKQVRGEDISLLEEQSKNDIYTYNDLLCRSVFSLCPEGAGINTIRFWESLAVGSIPVLMISTSHIPMLFRLHPNLHKCCIVVFKDAVINVFKFLRSISKEVIKEKQELCRSTYLDIKNLNTFKNQYNTLFEVY